MPGWRLAPGPRHSGAMSSRQFPDPSKVNKRWWIFIILLLAAAVILSFLVAWHTGHGLMTGASMVCWQRVPQGQPHLTGKWRSDLRAGAASPAGDIRTSPKFCGFIRKLMGVLVGRRHRRAWRVTASGELPRVFRTGKLRLFHAASCPFRYSSRTSCGVRYPSVEWTRVLL